MAESDDLEVMLRHTSAAISHSRDAANAKKRGKTMEAEESYEKKYANAAQLLLHHGDRDEVKVRVTGNGRLVYVKVRGGGNFHLHRDEFARHVIGNGFSRDKAYDVLTRAHCTDLPCIVEIYGPAP
jgi:hypothetical protein